VATKVAYATANRAEFDEELDVNRHAGHLHVPDNFDIHRDKKHGICGLMRKLGVFENESWAWRFQKKTYMGVKPKVRLMMVYNQNCEGVLCEVVGCYSHMSRIEVN
jgi:hypothetical protein